MHMLVVELIFDSLCSVGTLRIGWARQTEHCPKLVRSALAAHVLSTTIDGAPVRECTLRAGVLVGTDKGTTAQVCQA